MSEPYGDAGNLCSHQDDKGQRAERRSFTAQRGQGHAFPLSRFIFSVSLAIDWVHETSVQVSFATCIYALAEAYFTGSKRGAQRLLAGQFHIRSGTEISRPFPIFISFFLYLEVPLG